MTVKKAKDTNPVSDQVLPRENLHEYLTQVIDACERRSRDLRGQQVSNMARLKRYRKMLEDIDQMDLFD